MHRNSERFDAPPPPAAQRMRAQLAAARAGRLCACDDAGRLATRVLSFGQHGTRAAVILPLVALRVRVYAHADLTRDRVARVKSQGALPPRKQA